MQAAVQLGIKRLSIIGDSKLVIKQVQVLQGRQQCPGCCVLVLTSGHKLGSQTAVAALTTAG